MSRTAAGIAGGLVMVISGVVAAADADDVACGSSPAAVNIPGGALALQTDLSGPVATILQAVGEIRTHSLLVHGNGYVTHSAMHKPTEAATFSCDSPVDPEALQYGYPGMEQIDMGALYAFTYGGGLAPAAGDIATTSTVVDFFYQGGNGDGANRGQAVADWIWNNLPYWDAGNGLYRVGFLGGNSPANYVLYQYRDMQGINQGNVPQWDGSVCSTAIAYGQFMSGNGAIDNNNTYAHGLVANALDALHSVVYGDCNSGLGFWDSVLADSFGAISCARNSDKRTCFLGTCFYTPQFPGVCTLAADQVANCFAKGICDRSDQHQWQGVRDDAAATATSISPDNLGGWGNHGWGSGAPYSVWSWDNPNAVYWSSPGNVYGCWR